MNPAAAASASTEGPGPSAPDAGGLFSSYSAQIFAYCLHNLGSRSDAEDALQTTFLHAHRALRRGVVPECESAWLTAIAKNACRWQRRTQARRATVSDGSLDIAAFPAPDDADREGVVADLKQAFGSLPERQRRALLLREWQGLQPSEIAPRLGASTGETYALLARARRSVATALTAAARRPVLGVDFGSLLLQLRSLLASAPTVAATAVAIAGVGAAGLGVERAVADRQHASTPGVDAAQRAAPAASGERAVRPVLRPAVRGRHPVLRSLPPRPGRARARASLARAGGTASSALPRGGSPSPAATPAAAASPPSPAQSASTAPPDPAPAKGPTLPLSPPAPQRVPPLPDEVLPPLPSEPPSVSEEVVSTVTSLLPTQDSTTSPPEPTLPSPPLPALPAPIGP